MIEGMVDSEFDALLNEALAPPARTPDRLFTARVQAAVAETERFRRWRRRALHRIGSEAMILGALAGAAVTLAQGPLPRALLAQVPLAAPAALGALLLLWFALAGRKGAIVI